MNTQDPQSSQDPNKSSQKPSEKKPEEPSSPVTPPLSSPNEPTRAYPADPSRTYSSDPSQYSYPHKPESSEPSKVYTTEPMDTARIPSENMRSSDTYSQKDRESQKTHKEKFEEKAHEAYRSIRDSKKVDEIYHYAKSNKEQTVAYVLLALGLLILLFFDNLLGGLIIGMVAGYYFAEEIVYYIRNLGQIIGGQDQLRYVVLTALLLGLFIAAPGIFIGAAIVATFKQVFGAPRHSSQRKNDSNSQKPENH